MIRKALGLLVLTGGVVLFACGDDDGATSKYPSADAFCAAKAAEECKTTADICFVTADKCKDARKSACLGASSLATGQGRTYAAGNAEACITATTAVYADKTVVKAKQETFEDNCARVFSGSKKKSEVCANEFDCSGTLVCDLDKLSCADKTDRKEADGCNNPGDICVTGLYCKLEGATRFCRPKGKLGQACNVKDTPCTEDLRCNGSTCVNLQAGGEFCDTNAECSTGFCNSEKKCQARLYPSETGTCKDFGGT